MEGKRWLEGGREGRMMNREMGGKGERNWIRGRERGKGGRIKGRDRG